MLKLIDAENIKNNCHTTSVFLLVPFVVNILHNVVAVICKYINKLIIDNHKKDVFISKTMAKNIITAITMEKKIIVKFFCII